MTLIQQRGEDVIFAVRVRAKARRERITGVHGDALKVEITAPPVEGKANQACIRFFAALLKVPRSSVTIAAGISSRNKVIRVAGVTLAGVEHAIAEALSA